MESITNTMPMANYTYFSVASVEFERFYIPYRFIEPYDGSFLNCTTIPPVKHYLYCSETGPAKSFFSLKSPQQRVPGQEHLQCSCPLSMLFAKMYVVKIVVFKN